MITSSEEKSTLFGPNFQLDQAYTWISVISELKSFSGIVPLSWFSLKWLKKSERQKDLNGIHI